MSETSVGAIVGYLRLDASQWDEELDRAGVKADELGRHDPKIKIELNATEIIAKLDAVSAAVTAMDQNQARLTLNGNQSLKNLERAYSSMGGGAATGAARATSSLDSVVAASRRLEDATAKVAVAQQRLTEVESNGAAKQSQILAAKNALTRAHRAEQDAIFGTYDANLKAAGATEKATEATRKSTDENKKAAQSGSALVTAIITLGPALVPIAGGAAAAAAGFGGMGAAGILAIVGIKDQMAKGTAEGLTYKSTLDGAKTAVMGLATTAAGNVLGPLQQAVAALDSRLPSLNSEVGVLATMTGRAGASIINGLLAGFVQLEPVMSTVAVYAVNLAGRFDSMMSGPGVKSFGDYALSVFPQVMATLESLVGAAVHLVAAFAPLGGGVLSEVKMLADVINAIDPAVLSAVATGAGAVAIGFSAWQGLSGRVKALGEALGGVEEMSSRAATGIRMLEVASGVVGATLAVLSLIATDNAEKTRENQQAVDDLTQALIASNGALDDHVRKVQYDNLQSSGVVDTYKALGGSVRDLTDAALGNVDAQGRVNAVLAAAKPAADDYGQAGVDVNGVTVSLTDATNKVSTALGGANSQLKAGQVAAKDYADATKLSSGITSQAALDAYDLAQKYGTTTTAAQAVAGAQQKSADQAAQATLQMQLENNAAGLLKQSLDALSGKSLSAAQAQNAFDSALSNMGDHVTATGSKIHFTTTSINDMSTASVSLRGQLLGQVTAAEQTAEAYGNMSGSSENGRQKLIALRQQIIDNAVAHGVDRDAVTKYIDTVLKVPKSVPPTKLDADTKAATAKVDSFGHDVDYQTRPRTLYINVASNVNAAVASIASSINSIGASMFNKPKANGGQIEGRANGGPVPGFAGGTLVGPGTGTSDSIMAMVAETGKLLRVSAGEFVSTDASRRRNLGALEAGNRGAVLQVAGQGSNGGRTVHQTFQIQPTDPYAVAAEVARRYDMLGV